MLLKTRYIIILGICHLIFLNIPADAQKFRYKSEHSFLQNWAVNLSAGATSYYGDLSIYDYTFLPKLQEESGPAFSMMVSKSVFRSVDIAGQMIAGDMVCRKDNISIKTDILEYNLQLRFNVVEQLSTQRIYRRFGAIAFFGVGNFIFRTTMKKYFEDNLTSESQNSRVPEFVYFFGAGLKYDVSPRITLLSELSIRQCQNDKLDMLVRHNDFDYYSYLSIGITYHIFDLGNNRKSSSKRLYGWGDVRPIYRPQMIYR